MLSSCPVKNAIKTLAGLPANTGQAFAGKKSLYLENSRQDCIGDDQPGVGIAGTASSPTAGLHPVAVLCAVAAFFAGHSFHEEEEHPRYGSFKIPGPVPIFLRCRKLII